MPDLRALSAEAFAWECRVNPDDAAVIEELARRLGERDRLLAVEKAAQEYVSCRCLTCVCCDDGEDDNCECADNSARTDIAYGNLRSLLAECKEGK